MDREFMAGDIINIGRRRNLEILHVGTFKLKTKFGWCYKKDSILIRPFDRTYKNQFEPFNEKLSANNRPPDLADEVAGIILCVISKMMEK